MQGRRETEVDMFERYGGWRHEGWRIGEGLQLMPPGALVMLSGWLLKKDPGPLLDGGSLYDIFHMLESGGWIPGSLGFKVTGFAASQSKLQSADIFLSSTLLWASPARLPHPWSMQTSRSRITASTPGARYVCNSGF